MKNTKMKFEQLVKKNSEEYRAGGLFLIVGLLLLCLLFVGESKWAGWLRENKLSLTQKMTSKDVTFQQQYENEGDTYRQSGEDPQLAFSNCLYLLDSVRIVFRDPTVTDIRVQVFYDEGDGYSEEKSVQDEISSGSRDVVIPIEEGCYDNIRVDLDGDFVLDHVEFHGYRQGQISVGYYCAAIFADIAFIALWFYCLSRKNRLYEIVVRCGGAVRKRYIMINRNISYLGIKYKIRLEKVFLILGLVLGATYAVLIPPGQVPDEPSHAEQMSLSLGFGKQMSDEINKYLENISFYETAYDLGKKQDWDLLRQNMSLRFTQGARKLVSAPSVRVFHYFPACIGYTVCVALNLPIYFCLQIAELCSVIFYAVAGYFALKRISILKGALFTVMILPMTLQQCASISYDVIALVGAFWVFSYLVYCIAKKEEVGWRDILVLLLWCILTVPVKPPDLFVFLLFFAIPKEKVRLPVGKIGNIYAGICKFWYVIAVLLLLAVCLILPYTGYYNLFRTAIMDFAHTVDVLVNTMKVHGQFYLFSMIGNFGWLVRVMPVKFQVFTCVLMILVMLCSRQKRKMSIKGVRVWSLAAVFFGVLFICLAMISWSFFLAGLDAGKTLESFRKAYAEIDYITGVQGRYFIPFLPPAMLALHGLFKVDQRNHMGTLICVYGVWIIWAVSGVVSMFWA